MKATFLHEPELQFGAGRHIDMKFGLMQYGPLDFESPLAPLRIRLGIVGTPETIEGVIAWLAKCRAGLPAKISKRPNLFPRFPGYGLGERLAADFVTDSQLQRPVSQRRFDVLCHKKRTNEVLHELAELFLAEIEYLTQKSIADVFVCAFPRVLTDYLDQDKATATEEDEEGASKEGAVIIPSTLVFHDYLKARAMRFKRPTQIIRPSTYDGRKQRKSKSLRSADRPQLQDEATRAWNLYAALYYKAGGIPWRLVREFSDLDTCFIGVSFYKTLDASKLLTSTAQIFNERGEGVIVRGGVAERKDDKQIHLSAEGAYSLLRNTLAVYRNEHKNFPARVVVHKSSIHNDDEVEGFEAALREYSIDPELADFVSVTTSFTRLFRSNIYPPLRGTLFDMGGDVHVLYTRGSVDFYSTYPGLYVPHPLGFRCDKTTQTPSFLAGEMLALTKMNWNNTQFDGAEPISIRAARQVGSILKNLGDDFEPHYRYYM